MAETKRFHIVIAEDNYADVILVREAFKMHGLEPEVAVITDGEEAIRHFRSLDLDSRSTVPDLVLLDMHLPKHDGTAILAAIRSTNRCAETPVIVMTSSDLPYGWQNSKKHAALYYFHKSSSLTEFMNLGLIVRRILSETKSPVDTGRTGGM